MNLPFYKLKKAQKHEFNFLQATNAQKDMNLSFLASKSSKNMNLFLCKLKKKFKKHARNFLKA